MLGLRIQLAMYAALAAALAGAGATGWLAWRQCADASERAAESARQAAFEVAGAVAGPIAQGDDEAVQRAVGERMGHPGVWRACVVNTNGATLAEAARQREVRGGWLGALDRFVGPVAAAAPIRAGGGLRLGAVRVEMAPAAEGAAAVVVEGVPAALVGAGLVGLGAFVLAGRVTAPLKRIRRVVAAMEAGDFEARVEAGGTRGLSGLVEGVNGLASRMGTMAASTSFINNVVRSMVDTLVVVDQQARIEVVNQATLDLLGYTEEELVGRTASLICVADGYHLTARQLEQLLGKGSKKDHEVTYIAKDGRRVPISLSGSAIKDASGKTTGYVCIGTDITDRKEAEAERERLHKQLVATSRQAGMAEVATGVLHNVGNVLNSVNVSASMVEEALRRTRVDRVGQLAELLAEHEADLAAFLTSDERGKVLPRYLRQLAEHLSGERRAMLEEVRTLSRHVAHIKDIISVQQSVSKTTGVAEATDVRELVEDAVRMIEPSLQRHQIRVVREFEDVGALTTDKHKVLQILVNLVGNAADALKEAPGREGVLTLRVRRRDDGGDGACVEVSDNGVGIAPEHLTRIFTHGFTTKKDGHGFGLHSAALAAKELQGSLAARSDGTGAGATFVLTLPRRPVERAQAA